MWSLRLIRGGVETHLRSGTLLSWCMAVMAGPLALGTRTRTHGFLRGSSASKRSAVEEEGETRRRRRRRRRAQGWWLGLDRDGRTGGRIFCGK